MRTLYALILVGIFLVPAEQVLAQNIIWNDVQVVREGHLPDGRPCREFIADGKIGGRVQQIRGTACRQPDGDWKIVQPQTRQVRSTPVARYTPRAPQVGYAQPMQTMRYAAPTRTVTEACRDTFSGSTIRVEESPDFGHLARRLRQSGYGYRRRVNWGNEITAAFLEAMPKTTKWSNKRTECGTPVYHTTQRYGRDSYR